MERLFNEMTDGLLGVGTCSGHVCMERLLRRLMVYSRLEHAQAVYVCRGFSLR